MQCLGIQVQTPWPRHCASFRIHLHLREAFRLLQGIKHGASSGCVRQVNVSDEPVIEGDSQHVVLQYPYLSYSGNPPAHVPMVTP